MEEYQLKASLNFFKNLIEKNLKEGQPRLAAKSRKKRKKTKLGQEQKGN